MHNASKAPSDRSPAGQLSSELTDAAGDRSSAAATGVPDHVRRHDGRPTAKSTEEAAARPSDSSEHGAEANSDGTPVPSRSLAAEKWDDAIVRTKLNEAAQAASSGEANNPEARWQRGVVFAKQISGPKIEQGTSQDPVGVVQGKSRSEVDETKSERSTSTDLKELVHRAKQKAYNRDPDTGKRRPFKGANGQKAIKVKKKLEEQHWLEMIDPEHRYGSNLKYYFEEWKLSDAEGNFFCWLDTGSGKNLSLAKCPREKLEKEKIIYLSAEERRNYMVFIDPEGGRLRWSHPPSEAVEYTGEEHPLVDTTEQQWTDLGHGRGVTPAASMPNAPRKEVQDAGLSSTSSEEDVMDSDSADSSSDASLSSVKRPAEARPGALRRTSSASIPGSSPPSEPSLPLPSKHQGSPEGLGRSSEETKSAKKQSKKARKGDVWIYASDSTYNIYLGIKQKGYFQHSSFLAGGPITSAGTLVIKDGVLLGCNPMSGHYRTKAVYFKRFIEELEKKGADLSQVKVGQTELKLWFVERANTLHSIKGKTRRLAKGVEKKLHIDDRHHQPLQEGVEGNKGQQT